MTILFLNTCLEPGKDGVGDYTHLLAGECIRHNHECLMLALNDPYVSEPVESIDSANGISMLRLPACLDWGKRVKLAEAFRAQCSPDWISLQFVPYGFNRKGLIKNLTHHLQSIMTGHSVHVMFHELWIGVGAAPLFRDRIVGRLQRYYVEKLIRHLRPSLVTTTNPFYLSMLKSIGVSAVELPLFGNIPVNNNGSEADIPKALVQSGICNEKGLHPGHQLGLFFGALYPEWKSEPFMGIFIAASAKSQIRPCLINAGRLGNSGEAVWKKLQNDYARAVDFITLGECSAPQISVLLHLADFGLATSPWYLLGKSGSVAAMLDHGLPVIVTRDESSPAVSKFEATDSLLHRCDATLESKLVTGLAKRPAHQNLEIIARDFLHHLTKTENL